ncbi:MAG: VOC family protein [Pseudomonadota bacterium]
MARNKLRLVAYLARDYDEAIAWFTDAMGFVLIEDTDQGDGKRWVRMAASTGDDTEFLIAKAVGGQTAHVGYAAGGRVAYFLYTDDFAAQSARMKAAGVMFEGAPRIEPYGTVAVFADLYGNRWDLIEPA